MAISPKDIYEKKFKSSFRGYNENEVDEFLDKIIVEFQSIIMEKDEYLKELEQLRSPSEEAKNITSDSAVADKLLSAQKSADLIIKQSKDAAKFIIEDAQKKAQKFMDIINLQVLDAKCNIQALKNLTVDYKASFQRFLTEQVDAFNDHYTNIMEIFENAGSLDDPNESIRISEISDIKNAIEVDAIEDILKPKDDSVVIESTIGETKFKVPEDKPEPRANTIIEKPAKKAAPDEDKAEDDILSKVGSGNIVWDDEEQENEEQGFSLKTDEEQEKLKKLIDEIIGDS